MTIENPTPKSALDVKYQTVLASVTAIKEANRELERHITNFSQYDILTLLAPFFEAYPEVQSVSWTQYTPYFNDGAPCVFSVNLDYADISAAPSFKDKFPDAMRFTDVEEEDNSNYETIVCVPLGQLPFVDVLLTLPDQVFLHLFGDHTRVTVHNTLTLDVDEAHHD